MNGPSFSRFVDISIDLIDRGLERFGGDASTLAGRALRDWARMVEVGIPLSCPTTQRVIRLTRTQRYLYEFETLAGLSAIVNACLMRLLEQ